MKITQMMKFLVPCPIALFLQIFFFVTLTAQAEGPAGAVLYCRSGDQFYLLLADDIEVSRGWSAFAGGPEQGESAAETAARETYEESRGFFERDWLLKQIKEQKPVYHKRNNYTFYFIEIPFVPAIRITNHPLPKGADLVMQERPRFAWIPESDVRKALDEKSLQIDPLYLPADSSSKHYWDIWLEGMRIAYKNKACPWSESPADPK